MVFTIDSDGKYYIGNEEIKRVTDVSVDGGPGRLAEVTLRFLPDMVTIYNNRREVEREDFVVPVYR